MSDLGSQPVAWAAIGKNGQPMWLSYSRQDADGAVVGMAEVVPLYRSPSLTEEERELIRFAAVLYEGGGRPADAATLRGLLQRHSIQKHDT